MQKSPGTVEQPGAIPRSRPVRAIVVGAQPEVLSLLNAHLRAQGTQLLAQTSHTEELSEDLGAPDVVFLEAVGFGAPRWKEMLHDARRRLPRSRLVLVTRGPGKALEEPARVEGADGLVQYPIRRDELSQLLSGLFPGISFPTEKIHRSGAYSPRPPVRLLP